MVTLGRLAGNIAINMLASAAAAAPTEQKSIARVAPQAAFQRVEIASLETKGKFSSKPLMLVGYILKVATGARLLRPSSRQRAVA
jgi:hypothetical protein